MHTFPRKIEYYLSTVLLRRIGRIIQNPQEKQRISFTRAFTLFEVILVVAVMGIVSILTAPIGIQFYENNVVTGVQSGVIESVRRTQGRAIRQLNDSAHGIYMATASSGVYYIFQGDSWDNRNTDLDEVYEIPPGIEMYFPATTTSLIFQKRTGEVKNANNDIATGTIIIMKNNVTRNIIINEFGLVNAQ